MAWEWLGIAGVGLGSSLTLAGQWLSGKRDERRESLRLVREDVHRKEDQARDDERRDIADRRRLYAEAIPLISELVGVAWQIGAQRSFGQQRELVEQLREPFDERFGKADEMRDRIFLSAFGSEVTDLATEVLSAANDLAYGSSITPVKQGHTPHAFNKLHTEIHDAFDKLRLAMRQDVGLPIDGVTAPDRGWWRVKE